MRCAFGLGLSVSAPLGVLTGQEAHSAVPSTTDPTSQAIVAVILVAVFVLLTREAAHRVLLALSATALPFVISYFRRSASSRSRAWHRRSTSTCSSCWRR